MAQPDKVLDILEMLAQAGLDFTPKNTDALADVWVKAFRDIPDAIFTQAAHDYLISETRWPAPAKIRQIAERVKANNGKSTAGGWFKDETRTAKTGEVPGIWRVTRDGWEIFIPDPEFIPDNQEYPMIEPPAHPVFQSWVAAQRWQENEIHKRGEKCLYERWQERVIIEGAFHEPV